MSNPPLDLPLLIWQGQTFNDVYTWQNSAGLPIDLTGYTAKLMARINVSDVAAQVTWGTVTGEIVLGGTQGTITFNVSAAATQALSSRNELVVWRYDLLLTSSGGVTDRLIQGAMVIQPAVTR